MVIRKRSEIQKAVGKIKSYLEVIFFKSYTIITLEYPYKLALKFLPISKKNSIQVKIY